MGDPESTLDGGIRTNGLAEARLEELFRKMPTTLGGALIVGVLLALLLVSAHSAGLVAGWLLVMVVVTGLRFERYFAYQRCDGACRADVDRWGWVAVVGATANGVVWGAAPVLFFTPGDWRLQLLLALALGGNVAAASSSSASFFPAFLGYAAPVLSMLCGRFWLLGTVEGLVVGTMVALFGVATAANTRAARRTFDQQLRLRLENTSLLERLERRTQQERARLRTLLDQTDLVLLVADLPSLRILDASQGARTLFPEFGGTLPEVFADYPEWEAAEHWRSAVVSPVPLGTLERDGRHFEMAVFAATTAGETFVVVVLRDRTEAIMLEAQLAQADLLASVGRLAASVAHEVNNPLAYVQANLDYARSNLPTSFPDVGLALDEARVGVEQIRRTVENLLSLTRGEEGRSHPVHVAKVLRRCIRAAAAELDRRALIDEALDEALVVQADSVSLSQLFLNLLLNAAHAIDSGERENNRVAVRSRADGEWAIIEVEDTGSGIPAGIQAEVFQPFFSTKGAEGTGLGLANCRSIVHRLGGTLRFETEEGFGTTFIVKLPRTEGKSAKELKSSLAPPPESTIAEQRLLVVDDDELVRRGVSRLLRHHDLRVAGSAAEALEELQRSEFDAVVCDLVMAPVTGPELYEEVCRRWGGAAPRFIFLTGGAVDETGREFLARPDITYLTKPLDLPRLEELLAEGHQVGSGGTLRAETPRRIRSR